MLSRHRAAPISETADLPIYMMSLEAARQVKVVLSGEGADELFAGYPKHWAEARLGALAPSGSSRCWRGAGWQIRTGPLTAWKLPKICPVSSGGGTCHRSASDPSSGPPMRILLVHRNFPGQFRYLAPALVKAGHKVGVLTWNENRNPQPLPTARYSHKARPLQGLGASFPQYAELGASVARTAQALAARGDAPDVILGSINWGETLFLREVWPKARHLGYAEFFYGTKGRDTGFDPEFSTPDLPARIRTLARRAHLMMAALDADALLAPTRWQASTFPDAVQPKISVIHDGVDTDRIAPDPGASYQLPDGPLLTMGDEVLTFVNRNLEPYRGYHILMRALPKVMAARPNLRVLIVGGDSTSYGAAPKEGTSWKQIFLNEVADRIDPDRLHFLGRIPYDDFLNVLRVGRAHAYLTYPFVLSWSMLEAMSLGCVVVGSRTAPIEEVIEDGVTGHLVDFFDLDGWADRLIEVLSDPEAQAGIRKAARQHIVETYDLQRICLPKLMQFVETAAT